MEPHTAGRPRFSAKTGRVSRTVMDQGYRRWREAFDSWFIDYLNQTNSALIEYMVHLSDGRVIRNEETGKLVPDFYGYLVRVVCVLRRPKHNRRPFPLSSNTGDIDNLYKAITDGIFESHPFKEVGINDRWIQILQASKRYTALDTDEKPHIEVTIERIEV